MKGETLKMAFNKVRFGIASLCFLYAIFFCGFAFGLSTVENMLSAEAKILSPDLSFSGGGQTIDYAYLLMTFATISACFFVFLVLTQTSRKLFTEVLSLIAVLCAAYFFAVPPKPGYIPGTRMGYSIRYLYSTSWSDLILFCLVVILIVFQGIAIWRSSKSQVWKK